MKNAETRGQGSLLAFMLAVACLFCFSEAGPSEAGEVFEDGLIYLADGTSISREEFVARAKDFDYILIGETHDAPHHHLMQASLLEALAQSGRRPAVGFEMLYSRNQNLLEPFNRRQIKVDELAGTSGWAQSWTYPFEIYAPIFEVAERFDLPVHGLNISKATLDLVRAKGFYETRNSLPGERRPDLPEEVIWPRPEQIEHLNKTRENWARRRAENKPREAAGPDQQQTSPPEKNEPDQGPLKPGDPRRFQLIQSLWDTSMAESAVKIHRTTGRPVVIIAGSGHVEHGYGIAHRINTLTPGKKIMLVLPLARPFEVDDEKLRASAEIFFASRPGIFSLGLVFKAEAEQIIVDEIQDGSRAEKAGLRVGDRVVSLEDEDLKSPGDFHSAIAIADLEDKRNDLPEKRPKALLIDRKGARQNLTLN